MTILTMCFGVQPTTAGKATSAQFLSSLARMADLRIDVVSSGVPGLKGFKERKFRKSAAAFEYLETGELDLENLGVTERAAKRGDWDVGSAGYLKDEVRIRLVFPGNEPLSDPRVRPILSEFVSLGAHYALVLDVESHHYGLCYSYGSTLSGRMSPGVERNMVIFGNALRSGERMQRRLMDLYPLQVVSEEHLNAKAAGRTLRDLIVANGWGSLLALGSDRWLWEMSEVQIATARAKLLGSDLMLFKH